MPNHRRGGRPKGSKNKSPVSTEYAKIGRRPGKVKWTPEQRKVAKTASKHRTYLRSKNRIAAYNLNKKYGLSPEDLKKTHTQQNGCCAICGIKGEHGGHKNDSLCVDHDHDTGKIRALLCPRCNKALGLMDDSPPRLAIAADYILKHRDVQ